MYRIIFGKIFLTLLAFCIPQILSASNDCSDTTDYDFASGNHYTDSGTFGTSTSEDKRYYFQVPEDGVITISADDTNGRISFRHKMSGCPNWDDGSDSNSIRVKAGDDFNLLIDTWDGDTDYTLNVIFAPDSAAPTPDVFNKLCYLEPHYTGCNSQGAGIGCKQKIKIKNRSRYHLTNVKTGIAGIKDTMIKDCWLDHTSSDCNEHNWIVYGFSSDGGIGFAPPKELGPNEELILYTESNVSDKLPGAESLYASYTQDGQRYEGSIQQCVPNYCETHGSGAGFQLVDRGDKPHGETLGDKTFEIFCYKDDDEIWHDLIALPLKNENNNFRFDHAATGSNYYDMTTNPRTGFDAIEINANTMSLVTDYSDTIWDISTAGKNYTVMGTQFSNINLTGTPLQIDWSATGELSGCDESKLRKALGQAVKYNTINGTDNESNDGKSICQISSMQFKIMDDYRFLEYQGDEVLQHSCKEMAAYVPNNLDILDDASVAGHFNILTSEPYYDNSVIPTTNGTRDNGTDIGAKTTDSRSGAKRPITVYCKYQTDLEYVWTFLIALDGRVTQYKTDLLTQHDSCSQMGLFFFVPNSKITFNRVREYLKSQKTGIDGWENYTGTIEEKIQALHPGNIYYLQEFKDTLIWPYGSFGVYKPTDGGEGSGEDGDSSGAGVGDGDNGRPINNISNDINLGSFGWVSILGENDLNKTNDWWISDIGAGLEITKGSGEHTYSPSGSHPTKPTAYYEPDNNYQANAWLNYLFDSEGWVFHLDDWDDNYPYYDYMCMSETNYDPALRYAVIPGLFNAIERGTRAGNTAPNFEDDALTTHKVGQSIQLDVILYKVNTSNGTINHQLLNIDDNKSVGIFLAAEKDGMVTLLKKIGTYIHFKGSGRIPISDFSYDKAVKKAFIRFYYCNDAYSPWESCWDESQGTIDHPVVIPKRSGSSGGSSESYDTFSIRPDRFTIEIVSGGETPGGTSQRTGIKAGSPFTLKLQALDTADAPVKAYNERVSLVGSPQLEYAESRSDCKTSQLSGISDANFSNGIATISTHYDEVGDLNLTLHEIVGSEYAAADFNDTDFNRTIHDSPIPVSDYADADKQPFREISAAATTLHFIPDHFKLSAALQSHNADLGYTYLSSDLAMSSALELNITAQTREEHLAENYNAACYAHPIDLDIIPAYDPDPIVPHSPHHILYDLKVEDDTFTLDGNTSVIRHIDIDDLNRSIFPAGDHNGTTRLKIRLNLNREYNKAVNPFILNIHKITATDDDGVTGDTGLPDDNATYLYARVKSSKYFYDDVTGSSITTPISIVVYRDPSLLSAALDLIEFRPTNEDNWYLATVHDDERDGNTTLQAKTSSATGGSASTKKGEKKKQPSTIPLKKVHTKNGVDSRLAISRETSAKESSDVNVTLETGTNDWLTYNKDLPKPPKPFYHVHFVGVDSNSSGGVTSGGSGTWGGYGNTGHTVGGRASRQKNNRLEW